MGNIVEMPDNYQRLLTLGKEALAEGDYHVAQINFEEAYNLEQTSEGNFFYVKSLLALGNVQESFSVANERLSDYLTDQEKWPTYCQLLLGTEQFIQLEKQLAEKKKLGWETKSVEKLRDTAVDYFNALSAQVKRERLMLAKELAGSPVISQLQKARQLERLPQSDYLTSVVELLKNPQVSLIVRQGMLQNLIDMEVIEEVEVIDLHNTRRLLNLGKSVVTQEEQQLKVDVRTILKERLAFEQTDLRTLILREWEMHYQLMTPFATQWVIDSELWVDQMLASYLGEASVHSVGNDTWDLQAKTLECLRKELNQLTVG